LILVGVGVETMGTGVEGGLGVGVDAIGVDEETGVEGGLGVGVEAIGDEAIGTLVNGVGVGLGVGVGVGVGLGVGVGVGVGLGVGLGVGVGVGLGVGVGEGGTGQPGRSGNIPQKRFVTEAILKVRLKKTKLSMRKRFEVLNWAEANGPMRRLPLISPIGRVKVMLLYELLQYKYSSRVDEA